MRQTRPCLEEAPGRGHRTQPRSGMQHIYAVGGWPQGLAAGHVLHAAYTRRGAPHTGHGHRPCLACNIHKAWGTAHRPWPQAMSCMKHAQSVGHRSQTMSSMQHTQGVGHRTHTMAAGHVLHEACTRRGAPLTDHGCRPCPVCSMHKAKSTAHRPWLLAMSCIQQTQSMGYST